MKVISLANSSSVSGDVSCCVLATDRNLLGGFLVGLDSKHKLFFSGGASYDVSVSSVSWKGLSAEKRRRLGGEGMSQEGFIMLMEKGCVDDCRVESCRNRIGRKLCFPRKIQFLYQFCYERKYVEKSVGRNMGVAAVLDA